MDSLTYFNKVIYPFNLSQNVEHFYHPNFYYVVPSALLGPSLVVVSPSLPFDLWKPGHFLLPRLVRSVWVWRMLLDDASHSGHQRTPLALFPAHCETISVSFGFTCKFTCIRQCTWISCPLSLEVRALFVEVSLWCQEKMLGNKDLDREHCQ